MFTILAARNGNENFAGDDTCGGAVYSAASPGKTVWSGYHPVKVKLIKYEI